MPQVWKEWEWQHRFGNRKPTCQGACGNGNGRTRNDSLPLTVLIVVKILPSSSIENLVFFPIRYKIGYRFSLISKIGYMAPGGFLGIVSFFYVIGPIFQKIIVNQSKIIK
jgi:hypothetical protein